MAKRTTYICDSCGIDLADEKAEARTLDYYVKAYGNGRVEEYLLQGVDLCRPCLNRIENAVRIAYISKPA